MWLDESFGTTTVSDPMNGDRVTFHGCPRHKWLAHKHEKIAREYALTITEVHDMTTLMANVAIFGEAALEPGFTAFEAKEELKLDHAEAKEDSERLSEAPPLAETIAILTRNQERMWRLAEAEPDPDRRKLIEDFLIASAVSLRGMFERAQERINAN
jgi:hypothetical protein